MLIVSLCGQPGVGKSTGSAYVFSKLKMAGINVELVSEFAKDKVWEKNKKALKNQAYVFGQQYYRLSVLENEVDVVVTDSPLILGILYNQDTRLGEAFNDVIVQVSKSYESLNYLIRRVTPYNPNGRLQSEEESDAIRPKIKELLDKYFPNYEEVEGNVTGYDKIVSRVLDYIKYNMKGENSVK